MANPIRFLADFYISRPDRIQFEILKNISFELMPGDRLGVLGHNGAGKSTLLRLISGIYKPTSGTIEIRGSAKGLFDISVGMMQQATGLENIYLRGLQMGMTLREIKDKIANVIEFTELENDIHRVFGSYSTGMRLRLAFAISTMIEPEILVLDEWLGAGDVRFRERAADRMDQLVKNSKALVLASHAIGLLRRNCNKGLVLHHGEIACHGDLESCISYYENLSE